jgi:hypothetical protein
MECRAHLEVKADGSPPIKDEICWAIWLLTASAPGLMKKL